MSPMRMVQKTMFAYKKKAMRADVMNAMGVQSEALQSKAVRARRRMPPTLPAGEIDEIPHVAAAVREVRKRTFRRATDEERQNIATAMVLDAVVPGDLTQDDVERVRALVETAWRLQIELRRKLCPGWRCGGFN